MTYRIQFLFRLCDFLRHFRIITPQRAGCLSLFPNLEGFKVEVILLVFWSGVTCGLGLQTFIIFKNFFYHAGHTSVQIFAFGWVLLGALDLTRPGPPPQSVNQVDFMALACARMAFHKFILWQGPCKGHTGEFLFFSLFVNFLFQGVCVLVWPFLCADLAD